MADIQGAPRRKAVAQIAGVAVFFIILAVIAILVIPRLSRSASGGNEDNRVSDGAQTETQTEAQDDIPTDAQTEMDLAGSMAGETADATEQAGSASNAGSTTSAENTDNTDDTATADGTENNKPVSPAFEFPQTLEDGKLELISLFQFSGINPDCGNREGTDIAAVQVKNVSASYLVEASLTMKLEDGTELNFVITNLPAGKSAMVFSTNNTSIGKTVACTEITSSATFDSTVVTVPDQLSVSVEGMSITLTNMTGEKLTNIDVYCRSLLNEEYFGGITYRYTVTELPAYGSATIEARDCILGVAEVVRVTVEK